MDKAYLKDLLLALKAELIRFRFWVVALFIAISFLILIIGALWPKTYTTSSMLVADVNNIIEPLMKGSAELTKIDRSEQAREVIYTHGIMTAIAKEGKLINEDTSPEQIEKIIQTIRASLVIAPDKNNYFRMSYSASDPDRAFDMLNAVITVFIANTEKRKRDESQGAYNFIDTQVQSYKQQLELVESKLKVFNSKNVDGNEDSVSARIAQLRSDIETLKISIEESQARVNTLQQQLGNEGQYQHTKGQIDDMRQRRQLLNNQLEQLLLNYQEGYPDIVSMRAQITELDTSIHKLEASGDIYSSSEKTANPLYEELRKQLSIAEVELRAQNRRMESLMNLQMQERVRAERVAANKAQLSDLTRDYDVTRKAYEDMMQNKEKARISMTLDIEGQGVSYRIQEPATFPLKPSGLVFKQFALLGPILGLLLPIAALIAFVMFDPHLRSARILQQQLPPDIDMLGVVPHYDSPLGERLLKKDMLALLGVTFISMFIYFIFAIYWHLAKG